LRDLDSRLGVHVAFTSLETGRILVQLKNYRLPQNAVIVDATAVARAPDGEPLFRVEMQTDDTAAGSTMTTIRIWSFAVLFAVLSLIAGMTLALVLMFSRRMARDEAEAAAAALEVRRTEERNAELKRHNDMLRQSQEALQVRSRTILRRWSTPLPAGSRAIGSMRCATAASSELRTSRWLRAAGLPSTRTSPARSGWSAAAGSRPAPSGPLKRSRRCRPARPWSLVSPTTPCPSRTARDLEPCFRSAVLEHDPEKWVPVFGKDHAPT
jgi:cell division protein FtsB